MKATAVTIEVDPGKPLPAYPGKSCGPCTACCYTVPVSEIGVKAFARCPHLAGPPSSKIGCEIYPNRPRSCRTWSCSWLIGELGDEYRPDRLGIVLDPLPDVAIIDGKEVVAAQFWVMRGHEDDWQQERARALILSMIELGFVVLWRMADPAGGQMCRAFGKKADGTLAMTPIDKGREQLTGYNNDRERFVRAQELAERTER